MAALEYDLFDEFGNRKYLTVEERQRYFESVEPALPKSLDREKRTSALLYRLPDQRRPRRGQWPCRL